MVLLRACAVGFAAILFSSGASLAQQQSAQQQKPQPRKLTDAEKAPFKKLTQPVYDKWATQIGPDLVKKAEEAIAGRK